MLLVLRVGWVVIGVWLLSFQELELELPAGCSAQSEGWKMTVFHAVNYERLVHASLRMTRRSSSSPVHLQVLIGGAMQARGMLALVRQKQCTTWNDLCWIDPRLCPSVMRVCLFGKKVWVLTL